MTGAAEFLLAGIHTSSYTFSFLLYHLANNIQAQVDIYQLLYLLLPTFSTT
jgi:cytochrome P450